MTDAIDETAKRAARELLDSGQTLQADDMGTFCIGCGEYDELRNGKFAGPIHKKDCLAERPRKVLEGYADVK